VVHLRHSDGQLVSPDDSLVLKDGDTLVLSGRPPALALAEEKLLRERAGRGRAKPVSPV
jgi:CPA2 family monovalent cation:H+ antiporter-2